MIYSTTVQQCLVVSGIKEEPEQWFNIAPERNVGCSFFESPPLCKQEFVLIPLAFLFISGKGESIVVEEQFQQHGYGRCGRSLLRSVVVTMHDEITTMKDKKGWLDMVQCLLQNLSEQ